MINNIIIKDLEIECIIGIHNWERETLQKIYIDFEGFFDFSNVISSHLFKDTIDYVAVSEFILDFAIKGKYQLLEALAGDLSNALYDTFPFTSINLKLKKPSPNVANTKYVGIRFNTHRFKPITTELSENKYPQVKERIHDDKVALITGSAKGLGKAFATHLGNMGAKVMVHYRNSDLEAKDFMKSLKANNIRAKSHKAELSSDQDMKSLTEATYEEFGSIDYLINNVGAYSSKGLWEISNEEFSQILTTNLFGTYALTKEVLPFMRQKGFGRIINIGQASCERIRAYKNETPYQISKTGILMLTKSIAALEAPNGITCNMISPGVMENNTYFPKGIYENIPMKRLGKFRDFFGALDFLLSPDANYITGTAIDVTGGFRL